MLLVGYCYGMWADAKSGQSQPCFGNGMMIILQYARNAVIFNLLSSTGENAIAIFSTRWRGDPWNPMSILKLKRTQAEVSTGREQDETAFELLKLSAARMTALSALAFVAMATPASAVEYCRKDVTSAVVSCSFDTLAQCKDMSSGRGGDCFRDPLLPATSSAYAYQPKHLRSKKPVGKR
jgi:hypothetical protein